MKIRKLHEDNELEKRAKQQRKYGKGLSPFCTLNPDAGNVEHNVTMFNTMNSPIGGASNNPVSGPHGGDVSAGVAESLRESAEFIELHYDNLEVTIVTRPAKAPSYHFEHDRDEAHTVEEKIAHDYSVPKKDIVEFLMENITDEDLENIEDVTDKELEEFVEKNFDKLFDKYELKILDNFRDDAREDAERHMNESLSTTLTEEVGKIRTFLQSLHLKEDYSRKELTEDSISKLMPLKALHEKYSQIDDTVHMSMIVEKMQTILSECSDLNLTESTGEYIIMAVTKEGKKQYYNMSSVPHWVDKGADATIFDEMDEARAVWFNVDKKPFKRVMIPNYDPDLMNEALTPVDFDKMYLRDQLRDRISFMMDDSVGKFFQTIPHNQDGYRVNTESGHPIMNLEFDTSNPESNEIIFTIDGKNKQVFKTEKDAARAIIDAARRKHFKSFDLTVESAELDDDVHSDYLEESIPENWVNYNGAWIYPVYDGWEGNLDGLHYSADTEDELKAKIDRAIKGGWTKDNKLAKYFKAEGWNPNLTDCPSCGDISFDSRKGRCTRCSYRESFIDDDSSNYKFVSSKSVMDSDGFYTDYTWYKSSDGLNVFVFGDNEVYTPEDGCFDFETDNDWEAQQWFNSYNGFEEDLVEGKESDETHLKLSGNMIEIPIEDNSEVGELGHPIQQGIGDPRRKKEVVSEATATLERPLSKLDGTLSSVLIAHKDEVDTLFDRASAIEFLDRIMPEVKSKAYVVRVKQDILKSRRNPVEYFYNIILKGDGDGTDKGGAVTKKDQVRKWAKENLNEAMWEKGDSVTLWWKDPSWDKNTPCYASCTYVGRTRDGKYKFESDTYGWMYLLDLENKKITTPRGKVFDVWNDSGWLHENVETVVKYPNGMPVTDVDLERALDYMYGTDRNPEWTYTDAEMQKAVYYWMDKTDPRPDGKSYMNEDYKVQFYQVFKNPEKPTENGKMIAQAGTEDEAKAKGDKLVGKGNYLLKAVCDDGKVRDVDLYNYFNESMNVYNVTYYMDSLDDNVMSGPHTTTKIYASSEDEAKQKLNARCTDKYYIPTIVKIEKAINEWYEFSDDDVEDDLMHAAVYGGDSKYCKVCGAVKEYDEDGFAFCPDCTKNESFDFDEDDDDEGKMVGIAFDVNAPSDMKESEIETIIRKAIDATDLYIPGYMEIHTLNESLQEKLTGYKITVKKDGKTFDDYACAYEEEGAIRQMKNKYGDDIEIMKVDDSRVIRESLTESDKDQLKAFLTSLLDDNVFEHLDETDRKYAESQTRKFLAKLSNEKLTEASYGGAFDIADDQYFMRDDLVDCAEKVIEHLNETFDDTFEIVDLAMEGNVLVLGVEGKKLGNYEDRCTIDMRKIRVPSDLTNKYSLDIASRLISDIKSCNDM